MNDDLKSLRTKDSLFGRLGDRCTGMERPDQFSPPARVIVREDDTGRIEPMGFATRREYELSLMVSCRYWANDAERQDCRQNGEHVLADVLYRDVLVDLSAIIHAVYDGDRAAALRMLTALQTRLRR